MYISLKSIKILYWLVTLNFLFGFLLLTQLKPEAYTWRLAATESIFYIVVLGLILYVTKLYSKATVADPSTNVRRFNSRIKSQLWGLLVRTVSGVAGFGIFALFLPQPSEIILFTSAVYAVVVFVGFIFDGRRYDEYHI